MHECLYAPAGDNSSRNICEKEDNISCLSRLRRQSKQRVRSHSRNMMTSSQIRWKVPMDTHCFPSVHLHFVIKIEFLGITIQLDFEDA